MATRFWDVLRTRYGFNKKNMEISETALETENMGKTFSKITGDSERSISGYFRISASSSIDLQEKKLAYKAEKKNNHLETEMLEIEQLIVLAEMETQVHEAEITQNEGRRSIGTRSSVPR
ncbi:hypothetical protein JTB14_003812 [Gonioctena quinquepunctata]|nr:hypothetical protein JTB14_003812 [Gonioctena quinquepunctata]